MNFPITCLLIDHNKETHRFFSEALQHLSENVAIVIAQDDQSATTILRKHYGPILIFFNPDLPGIDEHKFILHLKKEIGKRRIPIIIYSDTYDESRILKAKKLGALDFFKQTNNICELEYFLKKYL